MKHVFLGTVALLIHDDFPFIPLHYHFIVIISTPQFTPLNQLHFTSRNITALHFSSLHCTAYFIARATHSLHLKFQCSNSFPIITCLQESTPIVSAVNWFQSSMILIKKEYLPISLL
jgi:hypothetical protein